MTEWLTEMVNSMGYVGIFLLLTLARAFPPIPSETVIPVAGVAAANGQMNLALIVLAGALGAACGEFLWYLPARKLGRERLLRFLHRYGHWLTVEPPQVDRASRWFEKRGGIAVLLCQPFAGVRTLIAIPAGAFGLPAWKFLLYAVVGSSASILLFASFGYGLQSVVPRIADYFGYLATALFTTVMTIYVVRLILHLRRHRGRIVRGEASLSQ
jgi:membrane protein DedA with SNARE-associated domain